MRPCSGIPITLESLSIGAVIELGCRPGRWKRAWWWIRQKVTGRRPDWPLVVKEIDYERKIVTYGPR